MGFGKSFEEPDFTDKKIRDRKRGSTTFRVCGWCEHAGGGTCRYDCMLTTTCSLMPSYDDNRESKWFSSCKLHDYGKEDIKRFMGHKTYQIKQAHDTIAYENLKIKVLKDFMKRNNKQPPLPNNRTSKHFNVGDRIAIYEEKEKTWKFGTVVYGYRHQDGCVSFHIDGTPNPTFSKLPPTVLKLEHFKDNPNITQKEIDEMNIEAQKNVDNIGKLANSPGCGASVPSVMLLSEYNYFAKHKGIWFWWKDIVSKKDYNGSKIKLEVRPITISKKEDK